MLEARLGARLLERTTRRLWVIDVGATYDEGCAAIAAIAKGRPSATEKYHGAFGAFGPAPTARS
jgi:DNA-binding transcriptional LysR family regulator